MVKYRYFVLLGILILSFASVSAFSVIECSSDSDCGVADIDFENMCKDSACGSYVCQNSYDCYDSCDDDSACASGYLCSGDGECAADADGDGYIDCESTSDCSSGYVCDDSACVAYCGLGETECSDGIDNDGDGDIDYGYCDVNEDDTYSSEDDSLCSEIIGQYLEVGGSFISRSPLEYCEEECTNNELGTFVDPDDGCASPLDTSEDLCGYCDWNRNGDYSSSSDELCSDIIDYGVSHSVDFSDFGGDLGYCETVCEASDSNYYTNYDGIFVDPEPNCDESSTSYGAPEVEQGFFAQLWDWLIFWK